MAFAHVIWAAKNYYPAGSGFKGHTHRYFQVFYVTSGVVDIVIGDRSHALCEHRMAFVQPEQYHCMEQVEQGAVKLFDVKFSVAHEALQKELLAIPPVVELGGTPVLGYLEQVRDEFRHKRPFFNEIADSATESLLWELIRALIKDELSSPAYPTVAHRELTGLAQKIAAYVDKHFAQDLTNESIASELGYNKNYCCMAFRRESGITIGAYISSVRIHNAVNAIAYTDHTFLQIAQEVGFKNVYHFSKVFKKVTGYTPSQIREMEREGLYHDRLVELADPYRFDR